MSFGSGFPDVRGEIMPPAQGEASSLKYTHTHTHLTTNRRIFLRGDAAKRQNVIIRGHNIDISFSLPLSNAARQSVNSHSGARKLPEFGIF